MYHSNMGGVEKTTRPKRCVETLISSIRHQHYPSDLVGGGSGINGPRGVRGKRHYGLLREVDGSV